MMNKKKVFLGGTCNGSKWREKLIPYLDRAGIEYFNPVVEDWTPACIQEEERQKKKVCAINLYILTPDGDNLYSIAELVSDAHERPKRTAVMLLDPENKWEKSRLKSMIAIRDLVSNLGVEVVDKPSKWELDIIYILLKMMVNIGRS